MVGVCREENVKGGRERHARNLSPSSFQQGKKRKKRRGEKGGKKKEGRKNHVCDLLIPCPAPRGDTRGGLKKKKKRGGEEKRLASPRNLE